MAKHVPNDGSPHHSIAIARNDGTATVRLVNVPTWCRASRSGGSNERPMGKCYVDEDESA